MPATEDFIKAPIAALAAERATVLLPPADGPVREYPLVVAGERRFRADWAFRLRSGGWLFIEDDDSVRALHNVAKYWMWMEEHDVREPVHLVHLIGPGHLDLPGFVGRKAFEDRPGFDYRPRPIADWRTPDLWVPMLGALLDEIAGVAGGDGAVAGDVPLRDEPAVGMWSDHGGVADSAAFVRGLRRSEWDRPGLP